MRTEVRLRAALLRDGSAPVPVRVRNLSSAGFMAEALEPLAPGTHVSLSLAGIGALPAEIRWNDGFWMGAMFEFEVSRRELERALEFDAETPAPDGEDDSSAA